MYGSFGFKFVVLLIFLISGAAFSKPKVVYKGKVINDGAIVYKAADFDSPVLGYLPAGKVYEISSKTFGPFYRIRVEKQIGYIADIDIKPINFKPTAPPGEEKKKMAKEISRKKKKLPFTLTRFVGPAFSSVNYTEDTLGATRSEALSFFGAKISGPDVVIEGEIPTEINLNFHLGAPTYYETLTGLGTGGFLFLTDFQLQHVRAVAQNALIYFGFGPMFRFSKFDLSLRDSTTGRSSAYRAEDAALGAAFSAGLGLRMGAVALRAEGKYFWEKNKYWSLGGALQFEF